MTGLLRVRTFIACSFGLLFIALTGCDRHRHRLMTEEYASYPQGIQRAIDRGMIMRGMSHDQVYLALGEPVCKTEREDEGQRVQVWLYPPIGRDACITAEFRVYFQDGLVATWDRFTQPTRYTDPAGGVRE